MKNKLLANAVKFREITEKVFKNYSPGKINLKDPDLDIGKIFSELLPYIFVIAGLALFIYLIIGGFELLTSAGNPESVSKAQKKITNALVGFIIIFVTYWLVRMLEVILGISILG